tara:strand:- start:748 stop:1311 length:564 start_codon:yes stop_codon:yes gene_type:complete
MNNKNLIIYQYHALYQIFKELEQELNFIIIEVKNKEFLTKKVKNLKNYIVISKKKIENIDCQLVLNNSPIKFSKLIEKINIEIIKKNFIYQSKFIIKDYIIDLNSREISKEEKKIKLTGKEVDTIIYISKAKQTVSAHELEKNVWQYKSDIETHTVETHIYRLRKKIFKSFNDKNFLISKKNGYEII